MRVRVAHRGAALLVALVGLGVTAAVMPAADASGSSPPGTILIAVEGPQSGSQSANGLDELRGVRLAVKELNAHGGLWNGRKIAIYAADDKGEAARAKPVAR